jgi:hypothetical protein
MRPQMMTWMSHERKASTLKKTLSEISKRDQSAESDLEVKSHFAPIEAE